MPIAFLGEPPRSGDPIMRVALRSILECTTPHRKRRQRFEMPLPNIHPARRVLGLDRSGVARL